MMWTLLLMIAICAAPAPAAESVARNSAGMVATVHPVATDAAVEIMKTGGNAIDAAVAAALMLGVVDSHNSGIGGGCFILIRTASGEIVAIDGREMAPAKATRDMYIRNGVPTTRLSQTGSLASGVPGALAAYEHVATKYGNKKFAELLAPAADVADKGFIVDTKFAQRLREEARKLRQFPETARVLLKPDNKPYEAGETLRNPDLAATYRNIAAHGSSWFYRGPFAQAAARWMSANGGIITEADLANYKLKPRNPIQTTYRGHTIIGFPPPSSGGVHVAQILNILEHFEIKDDRPVERIHIIAEAMKLAFADRAHWLGDPDFVNVPRGLIDRDYAATLAKQISSDAAGKFNHGQPPRAGSDHFNKHTTHIAAADKHGNFVAITTTLNTAFGSGVIIPGTGVLLNNQMDDFAIAPGQPNHFKLIGADANAIAPGKRPLSSMSPTIVLKDGHPVMTLGAAGGPTIITQVTLVLSNVIDLGDDLPRAMERPRFHHQWSPDKLSIERTVPEEARKQLEQLGHAIDVKKPSGATNAILRTSDGAFIGVSEPRLKGKAAGVD